LASFRKINSASVQLDVDAKHLFESCVVADEFSKHLQSVYKNTSPVVFPNLSSSSEFLSLAQVSDSDISEAITLLGPYKSVGVHDITGFIIKGCTDRVVPALKRIFNLSLSQQYFPTIWKQAATVLVSKKGNRSSDSNYRRIFLLNNFSKLFEFVIMDMFRII
jgi:hypothetical protein